MADSLKSILLPYQRRWIADTSQVRVCEKSRRIGITWTEAADCALHAASRKGSDVWYIGYSLDLAREFVEAVAMWSRRLNKAAAAIEQIAVEDEAHDIMAFRVRFASGHKVVALSSRPTNLRGKDGWAVIDEAAFHPDLDGLLEAALAFTMWGGSVHVISTHNGAESEFNELVTDVRAGRRDYSLHRVDFDEAIAQGLYRKICAVKDDAWSLRGEQDWREQIMRFYAGREDQELFCIPRASTGSFLSSVLIESRMDDDVPVLRFEMDPTFVDRGEEVRRREAVDFCEANLRPILDSLDRNMMTCFGEDFGRTADLTVIWPLQIEQGLHRRTPFVIEMRNVPFRQQEEVLFYVVDRLPRFVSGAMDARGNGQYLAEQARHRYGARVEQVMLSTEWYRDNMPRYKAAFEDGQISLPKDSDILADHRALVLENGVARIAEGRNTGSRERRRHGDSAIAGALAWYASRTPPREYAYTPAPRRGRFDEVASDRGLAAEMEEDERDTVSRWSRFRSWAAF